MSAQGSLLAPYQYGERLSCHWYAVKDGDYYGLRLYSRHYSCRRYADGRLRRRFVGPGEYLALVTANGDALWVWRRFRPTGSRERVVSCAVFRNESDVLSSLLVAEATEIGRRRWPNETLETLVNPRKVRSSNPGCCFLKGGWRRAGFTKGGLLRLEALR